MAKKSETVQCPGCGMTRMRAEVEAGVECDACMDD